MRIAPHRIAALVLALAGPIGSGCTGGGVVSSAGAGGVQDFSSGDGQQFDGADFASAGSGLEPGPGVWTKLYGDADDQHASALAVSPDGDIALAGNARGTIDLGNIPWTGASTDTDVFVAKISSEGQSQWSRRYGDSCDQHAGAVAHLPAGNVLLAGDFCGKMDFGTSAVETKSGEVDLFVAAIDTLGEDIYSVSFGGKGAQIARGAAVDGAGNAVIVGSFDQAFDDGTGEAPSAGLDDVFVLELDPKGKVLWSRRFGGPESDIVRSVAVDPKGNIVLGGSFGGSLDFGGGPLTAAAGHRGGFVVELDPAGKHLWSRSFGTDDDAAVTGVAFGPEGKIAATGFFMGTADFGGGPVTSEDAEDVFLAMLDDAGNPLWDHAFGGPKSQRATGVAVGPNGEAVISGTSEESFDLAKLAPNIALQPLFNLIGPGMAYSVRFDVSGTPVAASALGSPHPIESVGVGFDSKLATTLAGSVQESLSFPAGPAKAAGGWDVFLSHDD